ncbi:MAG TPA: hypothetical protein VK501_24895 [Baekduia sp.]|uniref:hypothetical protein n=1 Tax=Baekduia sp. TaxID=2600305 RepID=UPI002D0023B2|nr:hypothetical protein [Baekduia sp.]HMJ37165.1 hypothetical protein [Baekduia sp.]
MSRVKVDDRGASEPRAEEPGAARDDTERAAEELAGRVAVWVARAVSRAREEGEDVWAEAQELRRRW